MEPTNSTQPEVNHKKTIRGWSLVSMLAAFVLGWVVAFAALQVWHGKSRAKADALVKPVVDAVQHAVDSAKTTAAKETVQPVLQTPAAAPIAEAKSRVETPEPAQVVTAETDERAALKQLFQRNIETVRVLTSR